MSTGSAVPGTSVPSGSLVSPGGAQGVGGLQGVQGPTGPTAVSANAGNIATLGTDSLVYVPKQPAPQAGYLSVVSTTQLKFAPYNGNKIRINGTDYAIPAAGIAGLGNTGVFIQGVAGQNLGVNSSYFIYAFLNGAVVTADYRTTSHSTSTTAGNEGVEIATGDDTKTLIGYCRTDGSGLFGYMNSISWFNRKNKSAYVQATGTGGGTGPIAFVTWGDESVSLSFSGSVSCNTASTNSAAHQIDGGAYGPAINGTVGANGWYSSHASAVYPILTEGAHTYAINVQVGGGGLSSLFFTTVMIRG